MNLRNGVLALIGAAALACTNREIVERRPVPHAEAQPVSPQNLRTVMEYFAANSWEEQREHRVRTGQWDYHVIFSPPQADDCEPLSGSPLGGLSVYRQPIGNSSPATRVFVYDVGFDLTPEVGLIGPDAIGNPTPGTTVSYKVQGFGNPAYVGEGLENAKLFSRLESELLTELGRSLNFK